MGDRSARVRLNTPDYNAWPHVKSAHGKAVEVTLNAGDMLFLPLGWWHHVESLAQMNVSINFWFEGGMLAEAASKTVPRPLSEAGLLELARCGERFLTLELGDSSLASFLDWLAAPKAMVTRELPAPG